MDKKTVTRLAYTGAVLTLVIAACVPFVLFGAFTKVIARGGLHIDPAYSGGTIVRTTRPHGFDIDVYELVRPRFLQRIEPFVQIAFGPLAALPQKVNEEVDLDGDGQPDVRVSFDMPAPTDTRLRGDVAALNGKFQSFTNVGGESFSRLVVRTDDAVVVRVPLKKEVSSHK